MTYDKIKPRGGNRRNERTTFPQKTSRREAALARQEERDALTPEQQLGRLNSIFGKDQGAKKERARLHAMIEAREPESATAEKSRRKKDVKNRR